MEVKPTTAKYIRQLSEDSDEVYPMTSPRGRVLIIHNEQFDEACNPDQHHGLDYRVGSEFDLNNLKQIFKALHFIVVPHIDLSSELLFECINKETKLPDHEKYGMFVMVILSHGAEGVIYGSDSRKISINDITSRLSAKNFPAMANKPKMVVIQACSGGFKSYRDPRSGTFMIEALFEILKEHSCHHHVQELAVKVRNRVLEMCEMCADRNIGPQTVHSSETLRKKLYFFPGMLAPDSVESTRDHTPTQQSPLDSTETPLVHLSTLEAGTNTPNLSPAPLSAQATAPCSELPDISDPPTFCSSSGSLKLTPLVKLRHLKIISTPDRCYTVTLNPDSKVFHAGRRYDSINGTRVKGVHIHCIRAAPDNQLILLETNYKTSTANIVTYDYKLDNRTTANLVSNIIWNATYTQIHKIKVQYNLQRYITNFIKIDDLLVQTGADSGKLYFYKYSTGDLIREVTHPDMKRPRGICYDTDTRGYTQIYVTDRESDSIFNITLVDNGSPTINRLEFKIANPTGIAVHNGCLVILGNVEPVPKLHIVTTEGEKLITTVLPQCKGGSTSDLIINSGGLVTIANKDDGIQIYQFH